MHKSIKKHSFFKHIVKANFITAIVIMCALLFMTFAHILLLIICNLLSNCSFSKCLC